MMVNHPRPTPDKNAFKDALGAMKKKPDEENFDEALAQAYRTWAPTTLPSSLTSLFASIPDTLPEGKSRPPKTTPGCAR